MSLRRLGIGSRNLPTKKTQRIEPSNFQIAGLLGRFNRQYNRTFELNDTNNLEVIFGERNESFYGQDCVEGFFGEAGQGTLYVKSAIGNDGTVIDATIAEATVNDTQTPTPAPTLKFESAYQGNLSYGSYNNNFGYTIERGARELTSLTAIVAAVDTSAQLASVAGIFVGDLVKFDVTGGPVYKKITAVDESAKTVSWSGAFDGSLTGAVDDAVEVVGLRIRTYAKNNRGQIIEVEKALGLIWVTLEPEVTEFYVDNIFEQNQYFRVTDQSSPGAGILRYPADVATVTFMSGGTNGTSPSSDLHWKFNHAAFDADPIRVWANADYFSSDTYLDTQTVYSEDRAAQDFPIVMPNYLKAQSKTQLEATGKGWQKSIAVLGIYVETWLQITDPFNQSVIAPPREIPNVGHTMGAWIRAIRERGIHWVPATADLPLRTPIGIVMNDPTKPFSDQDRTDLAERGVNIIQNRENVGIQIRNWFTLSTLVEYAHGNSLIMRNFFRQSVRENLTLVENEPNVARRISKGRDRILAFMYEMWRSGSNGSVETGETFGQLINDDGSVTQPEDHFEVIADPSNNPISDLVKGERDYDIYFTVPTPTGSIEVGVGLILLS